MTEADFLDRVGRALSAELGRPVAMHEFAERYWDALGPNEAMLDLAARVRAAGYRTALLTNNVREWEPRWRAIFAVDELFELVVDSAFVGLRKPDPAIYRLTCERLGLPAEAVPVRRRPRAERRGGAGASASGRCSTAIPSRRWPRCSRALAGG